jgi:hypothetical protein
VIDGFETRLLFRVHNIDGAQLNGIVSLEDWNRYRNAYWKAKLVRNFNPELFPNGLKCPECSGALYDTNQVFPGPPSKMRVKCQSCKYRGERLE